MSFFTLSWARINNLTSINQAISKEIVYKKQNRQVVPQLALPGIVRVKSLKILSVTMTNELSAADHVRASSPTARRLSIYICVKRLACPRRVLLCPANHLSDHQSPFSNSRVDARADFFSVKIINVWNRLSDEIANASSISFSYYNILKTDLSYCYNWKTLELYNTLSSSFNKYYDYVYYAWR